MPDQDDSQQEIMTSWWTESKSEIKCNSGKNYC